VQSQFITAVALYGPKPEPLKGFLNNVQDILHRQVGAAFRPYSLEQIHGTLVRLDWLIDSRSGLLINAHYRDATGTSSPMLPDRAMEILDSSLKSPLDIRIGGHEPEGRATFSSRGTPPHERMFSVQGQAFVLVGWPLSTIRCGIADKPLDDLRRKMNSAHIMHWYHKSHADIDNDFHVVVGHHADASPSVTSAAAKEVRNYLTKHPIEISVDVRQVAIITSDSPTLAPANFIGRIPEDHEDIMKLFE
jgi:hypothetical protein